MSEIVSSTPATTTRLLPFRLAFAVGAVLVLAACGSGGDDDSSNGADAQLVTVYTGRHYGIEPVFDAFTEQTGIQVRFTTGRDPELRERLIAEGEERALEIVKSWVANDPLYIDSDTDILKAIAQGECDVAIANSYYLGRLLSEDPAFPVAIVWPEQDGRGAHVNVSTAAVTRHVPHPQPALQLLEWLATDGQKAFADANFEYPADPDVAPADLVAGWGEFTADLAVIRDLGSLNAAAVELLSRAGYE